MTTFYDMNIKDVYTVLRYTPTRKKWSVTSRKDHFIGIKLSGSTFHDFGYKSFELSENSVYFFNKKDDYYTNVNKIGESLSVHFSTYEDIDTDSFCIRIENPTLFIETLEKLDSLIKQKHVNRHAMLSTMYKLCSMLNDVKNKAYHPKDSRIFEAKEYIDQNYTQPDCLTRAIEDCGLSSRRFYDLFKQHFHQTPTQYITSQKINYAKTLLYTKNASIAEISALCGFSDVYYFSKLFKKIAGVSPSQWNSKKN